MTTVRSREDEVLELLRAQHAGDAKAREALFALLYDELRRLAARHMRNEPDDHTLAPTSLVHEVYLRLQRVPFDCDDRDQFLRLVSTVMRRTLVDGARRRRARRRAIDRRLGSPGGEGERRDDWILALEESLAELERVDADLSRVVELRFFAGLDVAEAARALGVSAPTVKRRFRAAKAWLETTIARRLADER